MERKNREATRIVGHDYPEAAGGRCVDENQTDQVFQRNLAGSWPSPTFASARRFGGRFGMLVRDKGRRAYK
jgi:hypothetical protein